MTGRTKSIAERMLWITLLGLMVLLCLSGCQTQAVLSAPFRDAAKVTRQWVEACQKGDADKAVGYWSKGDPKLALSETIYLSDLYKTTPFEIAGIEDWSSLISSGELLVVVQRPDGKQGALVVHLANSESGLVVTRVGYLASTYGFNYFPGSGYGDARGYGFYLDANFWY